MRITLGSPASRGTEPGAALVDRLIDPTRRAADRAAEVDLALAIENHGDLRAEEVMEVIERADRANLGVTLDNVNLIRLGEDMIEGTRLLAPRTLLVQLKDHLPGDPRVWGGPVSTALGEGIADLNGVLAVLDDQGFEGAVCVELASLGGGQVDELAMIARSVRWLRANVPRGPRQRTDARCRASPNRNGASPGGGSATPRRGSGQAGNRSRQDRVRASRRRAGRR